MASASFTEHLRPIISVIVPVYNTEKFIDRCIDSLLGQSFENFELIMVNDGSRDSSGVICKKYALKDKRIRVVDKKNEGVSAARNTGLDSANGDWIVFVDSDDYVERGYIESLFKTVQKGKMKFGMTGLTKISVDGTVIYSPDTIKKYTLDRDACIEMLFSYSNGYWGYVWGKIYNRQILRKHNIKFRNNIYFNEDRLFCLEYLSVLNAKDKISANTGSYYNYIIHENSATAKPVNERNLTELDAYIIMDSLIKERIGSGMMSAIIRCRCLDSLEYLKNQFTEKSSLTAEIKERMHKIYNDCISIVDLFPPYYGNYSKRLIKAYFKRP